MPFTFPSSSTVSFAADAADAAEALFAELLPLSLPHPVNIDATITAVKTAATAFLFMIFPSCVVPAAFSAGSAFACPLSGPFIYIPLFPVRQINR
jgi:hypothetical protein